MVKTWDKISLVFGFILGPYLLLTGSEWYHYFLGAVGLVGAFHVLYKYSKEKKIAKPLETLKQRYASGEITKEDFDKMRKDIEV